MNERKKGNSDFERRKIIMEQFPPFVRFNEFDFYCVCPCSIEELQSSSRHRRVVAWRNIGMLWLFMSGRTYERAGKKLGRHHTTAMHGTKEVLLSIEGFGIVEIRENLEEMYKHIQEFCEPSDEFIENEMISLVQLDKLFSELIESKN